MTLSFKKLTIHHFLSMGDCEIDLSNRGYCLVSGINNNPSDAAKSNGSGKSTIWSALTYAISGKTVQGTSSELPNKFFNDGCWVTLEMSADGHEYKITRSKDDKALGTNLKVIVDGADKSGKGIQESQKVLSELLPDLNEELMGSIVILGQGMPDKFTKNTPAKRKEILEHLSKSDFMIEDLKRRIAKRASALSDMMRDVEDSTLRDSTLKSTFASQLKKAQDELNSLENGFDGVDFDGKIKDLQGKLDSLEAAIKTTSDSIASIGEDIDKANASLLESIGAKSDAIEKVKKAHEEYAREDAEEKSKLTGDIYILSSEIAKMKEITDICPTCGQVIPNVSKPDTSAKEAELDALNAKLANLNELIAEDNNDYRNALSKIENDFSSSIESIQTRISQMKEELRKLNQGLYALNNDKFSASQRLAEMKAKASSYNETKKRIEGTVADLSEKLDGLTKSLASLSEKEANFRLHLEVINKIGTYIKRDFRGYLLSNVIDYIGAKAKEYSSQIFGTDNIKFALDGNNIDISFCEKSYENLSGGEKQRVDLIVQFAIRDMMCRYLDFSSNILVLDEITDNLDSVSCDRVLGFITNELRDIESVFIISHHSNELGIASDGEIVVMKDENGVSEVTCQY